MSPKLRTFKCLVCILVLKQTGFKPQQATDMVLVFHFSCWAVISYAVLRSVVLLLNAPNQSLWKPSGLVFIISTHIFLWVPHIWSLLPCFFGVRRSTSRSPPSFPWLFSGFRCQHHILFHTSCPFLLLFSGFSGQHSQSLLYFLSFLQLFSGFSGQHHVLFRTSYLFSGFSRGSVVSPTLGAIMSGSVPPT